MTDALLTANETMEIVRKCKTIIVSKMIIIAINIYELKVYTDLRHNIHMQLQKEKITTRKIEA